VDDLLHLLRKYRYLDLWLRLRPMLGFPPLLWLPPGVLGQIDVLGFRSRLVDV